MIAQKCPTNEQIREMAMENIPLHGIQQGGKGDYLLEVVEEFNRLQFRYFPSFCEDARIVNLKMLKELDQHGYRTSTKMIGGKVYEGTSGWSKDGTFKHKWIIPNQLKYFMVHIDKAFWDDSNHKPRDKFMKGVLRGDDPLELLDGVYKYYGENVIKSVSQEDKQALGIS